MIKDYSGRNEKNYFVYDGWGAGWYFWDGVIGWGIEGVGDHCLSHLWFFLCIVKLSKIES